jgi:hypothetical protein
MDELQQSFEDFIRPNVADVDMSKHANGEVYVDPGVQTAWVGYQVLQTGLSYITTESQDCN